MVIEMLEKLFLLLVFDCLCTLLTTCTQSSDHIHLHYKKRRDEYEKSVRKNIMSCDSTSEDRKTRYITRPVHSAVAKMKIMKPFKFLSG